MRFICTRNFKVRTDRQRLLKRMHFAFARSLFPRNNLSLSVLFFELRARLLLFPRAQQQRHFLSTAKRGLTLPPLIPVRAVRRPPRRAVYTAYQPYTLHARESLFFLFFFFSINFTSLQLKPFFFLRLHSLCARPRRRTYIFLLQVYFLYI